MRSTVLQLPTVSGLTLCGRSPAPAVRLPPSAVPRGARGVCSCSAGGGPSASEDDPAPQLQQADWREFRARLARGLDKWGQSASEGSAGADAGPSSRASAADQEWAHALVRPETGCLVLAHPSAFSGSQQYFHQAVIFLFAHSEEGSAGVILNRATEYRLGQLAGFEELMPEFAEVPLYMGGDVGASSTHVLHGVRDLQAATQVVEGIYIGGYAAIKEHVASGKSQADDYRWFSRYAGWGPGQLEREVASGVWYLASSSKNLVLDHTDSSPATLWRRVLELMGGEYVGISKRAYGDL